MGSLEFCGFLDTYEKLGYPNYVRLLVSFGVVGLWGCGVLWWPGLVVWSAGRATNNQAFCSAPCMANMRPTMIELLRAWNSHEYATFFPDITYTSVTAMLMGRYEKKSCHW